jgi:CheY-like chemotaxis protein
MAELKKIHKFNPFNDGQELMDYLSDPDIVVPLYFVLDLNMPYMSAWMFKKIIRANGRFRWCLYHTYIPTSSSEKDIEETLLKELIFILKKTKWFHQIKKSD